jgi:hypothetical protein
VRTLSTWQLISLPRAMDSSREIMMGLHRYQCENICVCYVLVKVDFWVIIASHLP